MKRICEFCKKEYEWKEGQLNWTKDGILRKGPGTVNSKRFCSYKCGINFYQQKLKKNSLEKYGVDNPAKSKESKEKAKNTINKKLEENPNYYKERNEKIKKTNLERYGFEYIHQSPIIKEKTKQTNLRLYGVENCFQSEEKKQKIKQTNLERYGVEYISKSKECIKKVKDTKLRKYNNSTYVNSIKAKNTINKKLEENPNYYKERNEKIKKTNLERYGVINVFNLEKVKLKAHSLIAQQKSHNTKLKNHTYTKSKPEEQIYQLLLQKFNKVERQYKSEKYPFACDFYISELDLYIEYQGFWTHGNKPYNESDIECINLLNIWKKKSVEINFKQEKKDQYLSAINVWTIRDPLKRQTAKDNNLNWIEFFNMEEFLEWYNKE